MPGVVVILITVFIYVCSNLVLHALVINWNLYVVNGVNWWVSGGMREVGREDTNTNDLFLRSHREKSYSLKVRQRDEQGASSAGEVTEMTQDLRIVTCSWVKVSMSNNWGWGGGGSPWKNLEWTSKITEEPQWKGGVWVPHHLVYLILQSPHGFLGLIAITCR